jgi:hypothetical protein
MALSVNNVLPIIALQGVTADVVLQPGSVVQARVVSVADNQVKITIAGQTIEAVTEVPLHAGQTLQVAVSQTEGGVRLSLLNQPATASVGSNLATTGAALDTVTLAPEAQQLVTTTSPPLLPMARTLTPQQAAAVATAAEIAVTHQNGLSTLFADLDAANSIANLPRQVSAAAQQVLAQRLDASTRLTGSDVQQAFQSSGIFLESSLAGAQPATASSDLKAALIVLRQVVTTTLENRPSAPTATVTSPIAQTQIAQTGQGARLTTQQALSAAQSELLDVFAPSAAQTTPQQVTAAAVATTTALPTASTGALASLAAAATAETVTPQQSAIHTVISQLTGSSNTTSQTATPPLAATAATISALQAALQANPHAAGVLARAGADNALLLSLLPAATGVKITAASDGAIARTNTPPPPVAGALPAPQPVMPANLTPHAPLDTALRRILTETEAALARQTLLQVASLPDRTEPTALRLDTAQPRWSFEIPIATPHGTAVAQFEISRDAEQAAQPGQVSTKTWQARFSLDVEPAGPVHALISLRGETTSVRMWAERPATAAQMRAGASQLTIALARADLVPGDIVIRDGAPRQTQPAKAGHFLDRAL